MSFRIGLLESGRVTSDLVERHGRYADMFKQLFGELDDSLIFVDYAVLDGELPGKVDDCDAYIVTGSANGVYERLPWMADLQDFLRSAHKAGKRLLGICFGHQLIADAFGGQVEKVDRGWAVGLHDYRVHHPLPGMPDGRESFTVFATHQDQVVAPPPDALVLAGSDFCPNAVLKIGDHVLTMQCHPEIPHAFAHDLLETRRPRIGDDLADQAQSTLFGDCDRWHVAGWLLDFLKSKEAGQVRPQ
ncbi:glutamine amidotransferase-related protein [Aestuariispira insulae]|uniref:GMP synthase-like glutamine amidotransferase n=1 Tax=Aestuariispira insulae TaxID=1461337 RepID=A0A3D9HR64_9PROT|nr:GMP synthase [Aestuariispira insulae]RED52024.1 GMP synthase-like glutamine amidotransferase [Aestuariispira insulae]